MTQQVRFALVLHNHQPIGNFDHVFESAYQDSYLPFLEVFEPYANLKIALHTSGPLMEWLDERHPEYVDRLAALVAAGRVEIIGGAYYEPILTMIPPRDRVGQIRSYTRWLESRLGGTVRGLWVPERVWEQSLVPDLVAARIEYTLLDDFHFKNAGLSEDELNGYYITEDEGRVLAVFPGSEPLRYAIPFREPEETIAHLGRISERHPGAVVVFGDDGEKFGTWPDTKAHVYDNGWLQRFFDLLSANDAWLETVTLAQAVDLAPPLGKIYLPQCSYREMTEWSLPTAGQSEHEQLKHDLQAEGRWDRVAPYIRGGFWRNFKVKYPETNEMYARMMMVSRRLDKLAAADADAQLLEAARRELYRGQCNCPYWHGAFGGIYLPHLRNAIYRHLIAADNLLEQAARPNSNWVQADEDDFNFDGRPEARLANNRLVALVAPADGGQMYELDVRRARHNLLATLDRRPEVYHQKVLAGESAQHGDVASIHDRVVFKQEGLNERVVYDVYPRKSLLDHFYPLHTSLDAVAAGEAEELGNFLHGAYHSRAGEQADRGELTLSRTGSASGIPVKLTKSVSLPAESSTLEIAYLLEGLPPNVQMRFAVEFNFAGMPAGADDRYFYTEAGERLGELGSRLDLPPQSGLGLIDQWLGVDVGLSVNRPTRFWTFPLETVSQSEGGFEAVHQSVVVMPHWEIVADTGGTFRVAMNLSIDTALAEQREEAQPQLAVVS